MTKEKSTKRALISSALAILMCMAMLIGTTFAWFTDTASTGVNKITSGNLHVEIQDNTGTKIENLEWVDKDGNAIDNQEGILWEPGCTYLLTPFKIVNTGKLALKYKIVITGLDGDSLLLDVIKFTYKVGGVESKLDEEGHLKVGEATDMITVSAHMDELAGNKYQEQELKNVKFTVYATQDTVENDSNDNQYDKDAAYPVANADELTAALHSEKVIVLANDITITTGVETAENLKQTLDFNGHKLILGGEDQSDYGCLDVYGELTLVDSVGNGGITGEFYHSATKVPTAVFINDGAVVNLESGTIENVYRGVANYYTGGTFNMTGGKIAVKRASEIESAGVLFRRGGTVNLTGGEISGAIYFEKTATSQPSYTIGAGFTNTNNSVFNTSGVTATQNEDGIWISTIM